MGERWPRLFEQIFRIEGDVGTGWWLKRSEARGNPKRYQHNQRAENTTRVHPVAALPAGRFAIQDPPASGTANRSPSSADRIARKHLPCAMHALLLSYRRPKFVSHAHAAQTTMREPS